MDDHPAREQVWQCHRLRLNRLLHGVVSVPSPVMRHHLLQEYKTPLHPHWDERRARGSTQLQSCSQRVREVGLLLMAITGQAGMTYWVIFSAIRSRVVFIGLAAEKALSRWPSFSVALWPITRPAQRVAYSI